MTAITISIERTAAGISFELADADRRTRYEALDMPIAKALLTRWIVFEVAAARARCPHGRPPEDCFDCAWSD